MLCKKIHSQTEHLLHAKLGLRCKKNSKMNETWSLPVRVQSPVLLKKGKTGQRETSYGDTK